MTAAPVRLTHIVLVHEYSLTIHHTDKHYMYHMRDVHLCRKLFSVEGLQLATVYLPTIKVTFQIFFTLFPLPPLILPGFY